MNQFKHILYYFSVTMVFVYIVLAVLLLFTDLLPQIQEPNRKVLGIILFAYTLFKSYKIFVHKRRQNVDDEN